MHNTYVPKYKWNFHDRGDQWATLAGQRAFMDEMAKNLHITDQEGWYKITRKHFQDHGAYRLFSLYDCSPHNLLSAVYPEYLDIT